MNKKDLLRLRFLREGMENEGKIWESDDLDALYSMFSNGVRISEMACYFKRSELAIAQRLHITNAMDSELKKRASYKSCPCICDFCENRKKCNRTKARCSEFKRERR